MSTDSLDVSDERLDRAREGLRVRMWSAEEFASARQHWQQLLAASDADPLFMSWDWQWRWWAHHADVLEATLQLQAIHAGDTLVGLAPFYQQRARVRGLLHPQRLQLIGTAWRDGRAAFSDYLDIIARRGHEAAVVEAVADWLRRHEWDELVLCCTKRAGLASRLAEQHLHQIAHVREVDELTAWCALLPANFETYVANLSSGVRRKMLHQRRKLEAAEVQYATEADVREFLAELRRYSQERWGATPRGDFPSSAAERFQLDFANAMAQAGQLSLSRIRMRERVISVMYNVRMGGTVYYLQSGFDPAPELGVSPGYLHFGYAIEAACQEGAERFDLLAGPGRHRDYKRDLLTDCVPVATYHVVRGAWSRALYVTFEALAGRRRSGHTNT